MIELLIIGGIIAVLSATIGTLVALKIQYSFLVRTYLQQEAWQHAQEAHQRTWEVRQGKHALEVEKKLTIRVQQIQGAWQRWEARDEERTQAVALQYEALTGNLNLEHAVARLPRIEEAPLPLRMNGQRQLSSADWQPRTFYRADLSGRDLSYRYLGQADLREAQLVGTNFFMSDLSGACLAGANLGGADLSGANLVGADMRNTTLTGASLFVTDLHNTVLLGANLLGARNLTTQQVYSAIYDSTTQLDVEVDITQRRIPIVRPAETPISPFLEDMELLTQQSMESPLLLSPPSDDSLHVLQAVDLLPDTR